MSTKLKIAVGAIALLAAFAAGRFLTPEKVRIETRTVEVEKKTSESSSDTNIDRHRETTTTETTRPDGTKEKKTTVVEDTQANRKHDDKTDDEKSSDSSSVKIVERSSAKVTISALAAVNPFTPGPFLYGASISKPILGPLSLGAFGFSDGRIGLSAGLTF